MNQEFNSARNAYLDRDEKGVVRQLLHTHSRTHFESHLRLGLR